MPLRPASEGESVSGRFAEPLEANPPNCRRIDRAFTEITGIVLEMHVADVRRTRQVDFFVYIESIAG